MLDNKKDDDGNGIADVNEIDKQQLMTRKLALALKTVNPNRMLEAWGGLAQAFAGVCAILKVQFAKVISLAVSIADQLRPVMVQFVAPAMVQILPSDYHHWIFPVIDVMSKVIGGSCAWFLFRVLAAVHSGMIGGLMCTRALLRYANNKKLFNLNHEETMLDEYTGWALAACGVYFQVFRPEQRQSARERDRETTRTRERSSEREMPSRRCRECVCVCVCACVRHRPPWCPCVCVTTYTYIDECIHLRLSSLLTLTRAYMTQLSTGMSAPFPLNILFLPVTFCETYLQVSARVFSYLPVFAR